MAIVFGVLLEVIQNRNLSPPVRFLHMDRSVSGDYIYKYYSIAL